MTTPIPTSAGSPRVSIVQSPRSYLVASIRRLVTPRLQKTEFFGPPLIEEDAHVTAVPPALPVIAAVATHAAGIAVFPS